MAEVWILIFPAATLVDEPSLSLLCGRQLAPLRLAPLVPVVEITLIFWVFTTAEEVPAWLNEAVPKPLRSEAKEVPDSGLGSSALTG